mgnify:CR=1 FL=1
MKSEIAVMKTLQLAAPNFGARLLRNNVGHAVYVPGNKCPACKADLARMGSVVRYGVGGVGGADLVGWAQVQIGPQHIGETFGVFLACEVKAPGEEAVPSQRQADFLNSVVRGGGCALVANDPEDLYQALERLREG